MKRLKLITGLIFIVSLVFLIGAVSVPSTAKKMYNHLNLQGLNQYLVEKFYMQDDDGSNTLEFRAPTALSDDLTVFVLPSGNGTNKQCLVTDGSGNTAWESLLHGTHVDNPTSGVHGATGTIVGTSDTQTLTNKTISADSNTISDIDDGEIKAAAAIARSKLASGTADHVVINSDTGAFSSEAQLAASRGGTGGDSSEQTGVAEVNAGVWSYGAVVDDLADVDTTSTPPEADQALVWDGSSNWVPGASGDSSFKPSKASTTTIKIKSGTYRYNGRLYCTYDGSGTTEADISSDLTFTPAGLGATEKHYLYIDTNGATSQTLTDSGRECWLIDNTDFLNSTTKPSSITASRYAPIGVFTTNGSSEVDVVYDERPEDAASWADIKLYDDKVVARYTTNAGQSLTSGSSSVIDYEDKDYDDPNTDNVTTGVAWKFTAPRAGKYHVSALATTQSDTLFAAGDYVMFAIVKNGATYLLQSTRHIPSDDSSSHIVSVGVDGTVSLAQGDYIQASWLMTGTAGSTNLVTLGERNYISIEEVTNTELGTVATPNVNLDTTVTSINDTPSAGYHTVSAASIPTGLQDRRDFACRGTYYDNSATRYQSMTVQWYWESDNDLVFDLRNWDNLPASDTIRLVCDLGADVTALPLATMNDIDISAANYNIVLTQEETFFYFTNCATTTYHAVLPDATTVPGKRVTFKYTGGDLMTGASNPNRCSIDGNGSQAVGDDVTFEMRASDDSVTIQARGSAWEIMQFTTTERYQKDLTDFGDWDVTPWRTLASLVVPKGVYFIKSQFTLYHHPTTGSCYFKIDGVSYTVRMYLDQNVTWIGSQSVFGPKANASAEATVNLQGYRADTASCNVLTGYGGFIDYIRIK